MLLGPHPCAGAGQGHLQERFGAVPTAATTVLIRRATPDAVLHRRRGRRTIDALPSFPALAQAAPSGPGGFLCDVSSMTHASQIKGVIELTINPDATLAANTVNTVRLTSGIRDGIGNGMSSQTWSFTTGA
jgi:hypothetical protein